MSRFLGLTLVLAFAFSAGCGKASGPAGSAPPAAAPAAPTGQSGPSDPGPIDPATVGSISGVVKLEGWIKPDRPPDVKGVAFCAACWPKDPPPADSLILGEGQTMANVVVHVKNGLGKRSFPGVSTPAVLDQSKCLYTPHVLALRANQPLLVRNSDSIMHNVNGSPKLSATFNRGQAVKGAEDTFLLPIPELSIPVKCDVHPWMLAWVHVFAHPFFQVTGTDGAYKLEGLPPGEYEIDAVHEKFPGASRVQKVKLGAKENVKLDFTFKGGEKPPDKK